MKTSNKLLLGFLIVILIGITTVISIARLRVDSNTIKANGKAKTHIEFIKNFDKINIKGKFKVHLMQGDSTQLEIRTSENLIPLVVSTVEKGELEIYLKNRISDKDRIELFLTAAVINSLEVSEGAQLNSEGLINGDSLNLKGIAGSEVTLSLNYKSLDAESHAGSSLNLSGKSIKAKIISTSGALIKASNLIIEECHAEANSGAVAEINVAKNLEVKANSGGLVSYSGNPNIKNIESNSGGSIQKK